MQRIMVTYNYLHYSIFKNCYNSCFLAIHPFIITQTRQNKKKRKYTFITVLKEVPLEGQKTLFSLYIHISCLLCLQRHSDVSWNENCVQSSLKAFLDCFHRALLWVLINISLPWAQKSPQINQKDPHGAYCTAVKPLSSSLEKNQCSFHSHAFSN